MVFNLGSLMGINLRRLKKKNQVPPPRDSETAESERNLKSSPGHVNTAKPTVHHIRHWVWHPTPVRLPGKSRGRRSLVGCSPWGREESDTTERLHFHFSLSCIGEGNGNPLQCSYLENPRDGGAWLAAVYGVAQSRTRLKRLSSMTKYVYMVAQR